MMLVLFKENAAEEVVHRWPQRGAVEELRRHFIRRQDNIRARLDHFAFEFLFDGRGGDVKPRVQVARRQHGQQAFGILIEHDHDGPRPGDASR